MQPIGFGLAAPVVIDTIRATGDELFAGFLIGLILAFSLSVRTVCLGGALACSALYVATFMPTPSVMLHSRWLALLLIGIGFYWIVRHILSRDLRNQTDFGETAKVIASDTGPFSQMLCRRYVSVVLAGASAFSAVILLGIDIAQELDPIIRQSESVTPMALGMAIAAINMFCLGTLLILFLPRKAYAFPIIASRPKLTGGALLVAVGLYFGGLSLDYDWPGDELAIVAMTALVWVLGGGLGRYAHHQVNG